MVTIKLMTAQEILMKICKGDKEEARKLWYEAQDFRLGALARRPFFNPVTISEYIKQHNPEFEITEEMQKVLTPIEAIKLNLIKFNPASIKRVTKQPNCPINQKYSSMH